MATLTVEQLLLDVDPVSLEQTQADLADIGLIASVLDVYQGYYRGAIEGL
ncbi:hypothetical protein [Rhizobium sp. FKL33]|nr:hypothetical protein [Rhizobium sp. FKL33]